MKRGYSPIGYFSFIQSYFLIKKIDPYIINFSTPKASLIYSQLPCFLEQSIEFI